MNKNTGGPAFPGYGEPGMTLRDYFAAKVMQGFCSHHATKITPENIDTHAKIVYRIADAMLKTREE